jgi:acyl carrier protein
MSVETFISQIENEFEDVKEGLLKPESDFKEALEWSSVNALIMITLIDSEYDILLNVEEINKATTINDLFEIIRKKQSN